MKRRRPPTPKSRPAFPRRRLLALLGGIAVLAVLLWIFWPRDPYALPGSDWRIFKQRFLAADGRIVDDGNGGISHSEGQGYGMVLAEALEAVDAVEQHLVPAIDPAVESARLLSMRTLPAGLTPIPPDLAPPHGAWWPRKPSPWPPHWPWPPRPMPPWPPEPPSWWDDMRGWERGYPR